MKTVNALFNVSSSYSFNSNPYTQLISDCVVCVGVLEYFPKIKKYPDNILLCLSDKPLKGYVPFKVRKETFNYRWCDKYGTDRPLFGAMWGLLEEVLHFSEGQGGIIYVKVVKI
jgi:hypothetical protein